MKIILILFYCLLNSLILAQVPEEMLIIFHQGEKESDFTKKKLAELSLYLQTIAVQVKMVEIDDKGVEEARSTPAIFLQNYKGRYYYKGRYSKFDKIANFIRTNRVISPTTTQYNQPNTLFWSHEKMRLYLELKITKIEGNTANFADFYQKGRNWIIQKLQKEQFVLADNLEIKASYLKYYFDFYPFIDQQGNLYLNYALYAQHDCINPIFQSQSEKLNYEKNHEKAFVKAAKAMSDFMKNNLKTSKLGDAATAVPNKIKTVSWEELGFHLPDKLTQQQLNLGYENIKLTNSWIFEQADFLNIPALAFYFAPPAQQYSGEAKDINGWLELGADNSWEDAQGEFVVKTNSVTMGLAELNEIVYTKILEVEKFPNAHFLITKTKGQFQPIELGQTQNLQIEAILKLKNIEIPVFATLQMDCYLNSEKQPRINLQAQFIAKTLDQRLNIEVPDAPKNEKGSMIFNINVQMKQK
jgi:YceI-like domain